MFCMIKKAHAVLGDGMLDKSNLSKTDGDIVHFLVTNKKESNYKQFADHVVFCDNAEEVINKYTDHPTELFLKVNIALASDSAALKTHGEYIAQLKSSILTQPLFDDCLLYRGVDLSKEELTHMETLGTFFIPSFTSTSIHSDKIYDKNTTMVIKIPYGCKYACSITPKLSKYFNEEREVLISCYSAFRLEKVDRVSPNKTIVSLFLDEHLSSMENLCF